MFPLQVNLVALRVGCKVHPLGLNLAFFGSSPICWDFLRFWKREKGDISKRPNLQKMRSIWPERRSRRMAKVTPTPQLSQGMNTSALCLVGRSPLGMATDEPAVGHCAPTPVISWAYAPCRHRYCPCFLPLQLFHVFPFYFLLLAGPENHHPKQDVRLAPHLLPSTEGVLLQPFRSRFLFQIQEVFLS